MTPPRSLIRSLAAAVIVAASPIAGHAADARHPAVVELFTSQGCSSCPPANENLSALASRPDVLALSFGVTYWDQLGWKDTFASPRYTARQWDYAHALKHGQVWTPQVVVNGRADTVGQHRAEIEALIRKAERPGGPELTLSGDRAVVSAGQAQRPADVWLVRYDPRIVQVPIRRGENGGRTLPHRNVVRELVRLGAWSGPPQTFKLPAAGQPGLTTALLVQDGPGGAILAAARG